MYLHNGKKLPAGQAFRIGEDDDAIQYPANWLALATPDDLAAVGILVVADPVRPDDRFYVVAENEDGSFSAILRPHDQVTNLLWELIKSERDQRTAQGGYLVGVKWFHSDQASRSQQLGLARKADRVEATGGDLGAVMHDATGTPIFWKTMDGSFIPMTATLAQQIAVAAEASDIAIFKAAETHKGNMEASANPAAYDLSGGWPKVFGEE